MALGGAVAFQDFFPWERDWEQKGSRRSCPTGSVVKGWRERRDHIRELEEKLCIVGVAWDDEELRCMLREGDLDGDGSLNEMGFCTLMFRLSPALMETSKDFLEEALACDF